MKKIKVSMIILLLLALPSLGSAIGIAPGNVKLQFEPGLEKAVQYLIINNDGRDLYAKLEVEGPHSDFIELEQEVVHLAPDEYEKVVIVKIKLPKETKADGLIAKISASETVESVSGEAGVAIVGKVVSKIELKNPQKKTNWLTIGIIVLLIGTALIALLSYKKFKKRKFYY